MKIIPTIFAKNKKAFDKRFKKLVHVSKDLQIDFMDGKFVKSKSVQLKDIPDLKNYKNNFEAHLMVFSPEKYFRELKSKGFKKVIFHYEATLEKTDAIINLAKKDFKVFLAINPKTPVKEILPFVKCLNGVLVMGVHPGKEHQKFIPNAYNKIKSLGNVTVQLDGGVNDKNLKALAKAGVDIVNMGSFIGNSKHPKETLSFLKKLF